MTEIPSGPCDCPFLRMVARAEQMMTCGIIPAKEEWAARNRVAAIHVAVERAERGCKGTVRGRCPLRDEGGDASDITFDPAVPLIQGPANDGQDHKYI